MTAKITIDNIVRNKIMEKKILGFVTGYLFNISIITP